MYLKATAQKKATKNLYGLICKILLVFDLAIYRAKKK